MLSFYSDSIVFQLGMSDVIYIKNREDFVQDQARWSADISYIWMFYKYI